MFQVTFSLQAFATKLLYVVFSFLHKLYTLLLLALFGRRAVRILASDRLLFLKFFVILRSISAQILR